jgi:hypothetical protein
MAVVAPAERDEVFPTPDLRDFCGIRRAARRQEQRCGQSKQREYDQGFDVVHIDLLV